MPPCCTALANTDNPSPPTQRDVIIYTIFQEPSPHSRNLFHSFKLWRLPSRPHTQRTNDRFQIKPFVDRNSPQSPNSMTLTLREWAWMFCVSNWRHVTVNGGKRIAIYFPLNSNHALFFPLQATTEKDIWTEPPTPLCQTRTIDAPAYRKNIWALHFCGRVQFLPIIIQLPWREHAPTVYEWSAITLSLKKMIVESLLFYARRRRVEHQCCSQKYFQGGFLVY